MFYFFCFVDLEKLTCVLKVCLEMVNDSEVERLALDPSSHGCLFCLDLHFLISL